MSLITILFLALLAAIAFQFVSFLVTCLVIGFKIGVVVLVAALIWKCVKAVLKT